MISQKTTRLENGTYHGLFGIVNCENWQCRMFRNRDGLAKACLSLSEQGALYFTFYHLFAEGERPNDDTVKETAKVLESHYPTHEQRYVWEQIKLQRDSRLQEIRHLAKDFVSEKSKQATLKERLAQVYTLDKRGRYDD